MTGRDAELRAALERLAAIREAFRECFSPDFYGVDWRDDDAIQQFARKVAPLLAEHQPTAREAEALVEVPDDSPPYSDAYAQPAPVAPAGEQHYRAEITSADGRAGELRYDLAADAEKEALYEKLRTEGGWLIQNGQAIGRVGPGIEVDPAEAWCEEYDDDEDWESRAEAAEERLAAVRQALTQPGSITPGQRVGAALRALDGEGGSTGGEWHAMPWPHPASPGCCLPGGER